MHLNKVKIKWKVFQSYSLNIRTLENLSIFAMHTCTDLCWMKDLATLYYAA